MVYDLAPMSIKVLADNRKAFHEYTISDRYEAGIALAGSEVKASRTSKINLTDGWVDITEAGEAILRDVHIGLYSHSSQFNHTETRPRKLLLHKAEIIKLQARIEEKGYTVIPLKMYFKEQYIKVEIGVAKGKKLHDKREAAATREAGRDMQRALRERNKG